MTTERKIAETVQNFDILGRTGFFRAGDRIMVKATGQSGTVQSTAYNSYFVMSDVYVLFDDKSGGGYFDADLELF